MLMASHFVQVTVCCMLVSISQYACSAEPQHDITCKAQTWLLANGHSEAASEILADSCLGPVLPFKLLLQNSLREASPAHPDLLPSGQLDAAVAYNT